MHCARCTTRAAPLSCVLCEQRYCSQRCLSIDTRYGDHVHAPPPLRAATYSLTQLHDGQKDTDPALQDFLRARPQETVPRFAQGCSNYPAFGLIERHMDQVALVLDRPPQPPQLALHQTLSKAVPLVHPIEHTSPLHPLVLVRHEEQSVYLHLGEDVYESAHVLSLRPWMRRFPQYDAHVICEQVGQVLGQLHFAQGVDAYNFAVTWSAVTDLHVHLDPLYTSQLWPSSPESVQCFGAVLGMSPYVPRADQGSYFDAFVRGYSAHAKEHTAAIVEAMRSYLS